MSEKYNYDLLQYQHNCPPSATDCYQQKMLYCIGCLFRVWMSTLTPIVIQSEVMHYLLDSYYCISVVALGKYAVATFWEGGRRVNCPLQGSNALLKESSAVPRSIRLYPIKFCANYRSVLCVRGGARDLEKQFTGEAPCAVFRRV